LFDALVETLLTVKYLQFTFFRKSSVGPPCQTHFIKPFLSATFCPIFEQFVPSTGNGVCGVGPGEGCGAGAATSSDSLGVLISKVTFPELARVLVVRVRTVVSSPALSRCAYSQAALARFLAELNADLVEFFVTKPVHTTDSARGDPSTRFFISTFCLLESAAEVPEKDVRVFWLVVKSDKT
jgi:hypothetical protein